MYRFAPMTLTPLLALALGLAPLAGARAQQAPPPDRPAPSSDASYVLAADDVISIQVLNFPELSVPQITVPPDGRITVPLLGSVRVAGKTTDQVAQTLTKRWGTDYVNNPSVAVSLTQKRRESVQIYGFVTHAQTADYKSGLRLSQALAQAGGVMEGGDSTQVTITHKNGQKQTVDMSDLGGAGGTDADPALSPDDAVFVPERPHTQISILGEVAKPGSYEYKDKMTVLDALKDADNVNPGTANLPGAMLLHDGKESPLDLDALLNRGQLAYNLPLAPGDRLFIPTLYNRIYVDGAVLHPGPYAFKPGDRLLDALTGSGGTQAGLSDLAKVTLIHMDKLHNTATQRVVDVAKFYRTADMRLNPVLVPGDALYVPVKGGHTDPISVLGSLLGIGTSTRLLARP